MQLRYTCPETYFGAIYFIFMGHLQNPVFQTFHGYFQVTPSIDRRWTTMQTRYIFPGTCPPYIFPMAMGSSSMVASIQTLGNNTIMYIVHLRWGWGQWWCWCAGQRGAWITTGLGKTLGTTRFHQTMQLLEAKGPTVRTPRFLGKTLIFSFLEGGPVWNLQKSERNSVFVIYAKLDQNITPKLGGNCRTSMAETESE